MITHLHFHLQHIILSLNSDDDITGSSSIQFFSGFIHYDFQRIFSRRLAATLEYFYWEHYTHICDTVPLMKKRRKS